MTDTTSAMRDALVKLREHFAVGRHIILDGAEGNRSQLGDELEAELEDTEKHLATIDAALTAPAQADIHATTDDELREGIETALRRFGGIPALARSEGGAKKIVDVVMAEIKAYSPTPPRVDEKEMLEILADAFEKAGRPFQANAIRDRDHTNLAAGLTASTEAIIVSAMCRAAQSSNSVTSPEFLRQMCRLLRDDMVLQSQPLPDGRLSISIDRKLWNDWCETIGDLASPLAAP